MWGVEGDNTELGLPVSHLSPVLSPVSADRCSGAASTGSLSYLPSCVTDNTVLCNCYQRKITLYYDYMTILDHAHDKVTDRLFLEVSRPSYSYSYFTIGYFKLHYRALW